MIEAGSSRKVALDISGDMQFLQRDENTNKANKRLTVRVEKASGEVRVS